MSITKIESRAGHLLVTGESSLLNDSLIQITLVGPAMDDECYACGKALAATEGKVRPSYIRPSYGAPGYGLYCEPPCPERQAEAPKEMTDGR